MTEGTDGASDEPQLHIRIDPDKEAGVWANFAAVAHSPYEFTLDFVRLDFRMMPPQGPVVSRVSVSPLFITQLIEALQQNYQQWSKRAMPREVYADEQPSTGNRGPDEDGPEAAGEKA